RTASTENRQEPRHSCRHLEPVFLPVPALRRRIVQFPGQAIATGRKLRRRDMFAGFAKRLVTAHVDQTDSLYQSEFIIVRSNTMQRGMFDGNWYGYSKYGSLWRKRIRFGFLQLDRNLI